MELYTRRRKKKKEALQSVFHLCTESDVLQLNLAQMTWRIDGKLNTSRLEIKLILEEVLDPSAAFRNVSIGEKDLC